MNFSDITIYCSSKEPDDIFIGSWIVKEIDFDEKTVVLSNGRVRIWKNFNQVNIDEFHK